MSIPTVFAPAMSRVRESPMRTASLGAHPARARAASKIFGFGFPTPTASDVVTESRRGARRTAWSTTRTNFSSTSVSSPTWRPVARTRWMAEIASGKRRHLSACIASYVDSNHAQSASVAVFPFSRRYAMKFLRRWSRIGIHFTGCPAKYGPRSFRNQRNVSSPDLGMP